MAQIFTCPDDRDLKEIALGQLSNLDGDSILRHIEGCSNCATRISTILAEDTLVEAVRSAETVDRPEEKNAVSRLAEKIRALVPAAKSPDEQTLDDVASTPSPAISADTNALSFDSSTAPENERDGLAPPQAPDEIGRLGGYRVLKLLGEGGMGRVFLAHDPNLQRSVALKIMKPSLRDLDARKRFLLEARLAAAIEHDHIVHIYQVGEDLGIPFFAMQLLKGESLEDLLRRFPALTIKEVLRIGVQIAEGLAAAHERGLIHRDIKPGNIWIESLSGGRVKILDFGLARSSDRDVSITQLGAILGTPAYMPPEQARGDKVDHRCDLYSLGCVLYRMVTGELPLKGNHTMGMLTALAVDEPTAPIKLNQRIPQALSELIMKLLAKDPNQRVGSAKEVARMLAMIEPRIPELACAVDQPLPISSEGSKTVDLNASFPGSEQSQACESAVSIQPNSKRRRSPFVTVLLGVGILFLVVAGVFGIIHIATPDGDYVIDTDDPNFAFSVTKGTVILEDKLKKKTYHMKLVKNKGKGEWELEVNDPDSDLVFNAPTFTIKRNEKVVLKAWFQRKSAAVARAGPVDDAWMKAVAALSPEKQVEAVAARLKDRNPGFAGNVEHKVEGMEVTELKFSPIKVTDLSPVRALTGLRTLTCDGGGRGDEVADLSPLKDMKLASLSLLNTMVADLSPLRDMPLTSLSVGGTPVSDLSPLKGMKLIYLRCDHTLVKDLSPLKNMLLTTLICNFTPVADLSPLSGMKLTTFEFRGTQVRDLAPLKGMKLTSLDCSGTKVTDLSPLADLKLTTLNCSRTGVFNLAPLKNLPLTELTCNETLVSELAPLQGMKLTNLGCRGTKVTDLSPLTKMPLQSIECDFRAERDAKVLRSIDTLGRINGKSALVFWKEVAGQK